MADASGYFGASLWQASVGKGVASGLANAVGQIAYNGGLIVILIMLNLFFQDLLETLFYQI